jgi:NADP-dependent 3-hydroxy acid dehydrogenase YdfG
MRGTTQNQAVAQELSQLPNVEVVEIDVNKDDSVTNAIHSAIKNMQNRCVVNNAQMYQVLDCSKLTPLNKSKNCLK